MFVVKLVSLLRHIDIYNGKLRRCRWWAVSRCEPTYLIEPYRLMSLQL